MKKRLLSWMLAAMLLPLAVQSQVLTHGPVFGAVTSGSARIFLRTSASDTVKVELDTDSVFSSAFMQNAITDALRDTSAILSFSGLAASTTYYCRITLNGQQQGPVSFFTTFPPEGDDAPFTFAFGSCLRAGFSDSIFTQVAAASPRFFLHIGDWGYPDSTDALPNDSSFFPAQYANVQASYRWRYRPGIVADYLRTTPVDYVYDDHDYMNDNSSRYTSSDAVVNIPYTDLFEFHNPPGARENSIRGYTEYFPAYNLPDTSEGIFHSFRSGNIEVFVLDNRSARSSNNEAFTETGGFLTPWEFNPPAGHSILGPTQLNWLLNGLASSTADWKFVATGTVFNQAYTDVIDLLLAIQLVQIPDVGSGASLASATGDSWGGFPADGQAIIQHCTANNIRNVIFLSGDSHNSAIDDGSNGGFPEIMSGNLAITNSRTAFLMDSLLNIDVWSEGGQGLNGNNNFNNCYGRVEIFGSDSVRLCAVDQFGTEVVCHTVTNGTLANEGALHGKPHGAQRQVSIYPTPASDKITIELQELEILTGGTVHLLDASGKKLQEWPAEKFKNNQMQVDVSALPAGVYFVRLDLLKTRLVGRFEVLH